MCRDGGEGGGAVCRDGGEGGAVCKDGGEGGGAVPVLLFYIRILEKV